MFEQIFINWKKFMDFFKANKSCYFDRSSLNNPPSQNIILFGSRPYVKTLKAENRFGFTSTNKHNTQTVATRPNKDTPI